jgi:hypothetical protein
MRSEPDENTKGFMDILAEGEEPSIFPLYDEEVDYEKLIDMIFEYDKVISWW